MSNAFFRQTISQDLRKYNMSEVETLHLSTAFGKLMSIIQFLPSADAVLRIPVTKEPYLFVSEMSRYVAF